MAKIPRDVMETADESKILLPAGRYLVSILAARETEQDVTLRYQILDADHTETVGVTNTEFFSLAAGAIGKYGCVVKRVGIVDRGVEMEHADYDAQDLVGAVLVVDVIQREVDGKSGKYMSSQWKWGNAWKPDHKDVAAWMSGRRVPGRAAPTPAPAQPVQQTIPVPASVYDNV
jgi:hypothetical protein